MDRTYPKFSARGRYEYELRRNTELPPLFEKKPEHCPHCGSDKTECYGHIGSNGRKRYRCKSCGKTFCSSSGTLYYRSRMSQNNIRILADSLVLGTTVIASAKMPHVSKNTAMRYRKFLLSIVEKKEKRPVLSGKNVQIDETYRQLQ